jgi:hypothetical protein
VPSISFPDYSRVIPANNDKVMKVDRRSFADAVDRVSTISSEKSRAVKLSLRTKALTLSATSAENGSASEEIEVDYAGNAMEIGFNARYLLDIAQQIQGEGAQGTTLSAVDKSFALFSFTNPGSTTAAFRFVTSSFRAIPAGGNLGSPESCSTGSAWVLSDSSGKWRYMNFSVMSQFSKQ